MAMTVLRLASLSKSLSSMRKEGDSQVSQQTLRDKTAIAYSSAPPGAHYNKSGPRDQRHKKERKAGPRAAASHAS